ncbi:MAG: hypothetical protein QOJ16_387, partial [Acidobacteriota bacterium]|nr:hypothetical protein [Acidobacteriota bacterium]
MADLAERFAQLSPAQRQLLLERLGRRRPEAPPVAARSTPPAIARIPTQPRDGRPFPLSFAQQRLWFLDQLEPGKSLYNMPLFLRLRGSLALPSLGRAFAEIERRHEVLRTTFAVVDEQAVQVVGPPGPLALPLADLAGLPVTAEVAEAARLSADEAERPFDLSRGPLCRVLLLHLGERDYTLLLTLHHVVCDGWSLGVLVRELGALYGAFASGRPSPLPPLPVQYADFAVWQRQRLAGEAVAEQLDYWKRQLAGSPPLLELPTDRPRSVFPSSRGRTLPLPLPEALWSGAQALARDLCATPFIVLLAVFQSLLGRHACQSDVVVGTPVANRNRSEIEGLIGFFVNTLVLRTDLTGDPAFGELLGRVRRGVSGAYAHQDLPFERLVDELQTDRHLGHSPLFQVMFILQSDPMPAAEIAGLSLSPLPVEGTTAKFDLMLQFWEQPRGLAGFLEFTTDLFDATTVRRLGEQLETLLGSVLEHPERPLSALPLLPPAAHHQLLAEWNDTWEEPGADRPGCLHDLFAAQAERTPAAAALVWGGASWSYGELDRRAERLSRRLRRLGVGPDVPVGICLRRSPEMAVAVLGVLAAGAAYIPLDPAYPRERLARMLDLAGARVLLTQEDLRTTLPAEGVTALCLDAVEPEPEVGPVAGPEPRPDDLAYVIFTSGSTGVPKGVALPHRALVNLITWQLGESTLGAGSKTLQLASLSFDVSCQELFSTWAAGGTLVLIPEEVRLDTAALLLTLVREEVERIFLPFVALQQLAETAVERGLYPWALAEVVTAGEQLQVTGPIAELFTHLRRARLWNQYGPSESHVATAFALVGPSRSWPALPPVGTPVANARIHLLDETSRPVPLGVPGELHIGGECLARGYFRRPELTAERFVPDPVSGRGERLYRTGDLARYRADGTLEFLGRNDQQVKIRGFRVEPGEIEAALATIPGVREAVVVARDGRLVAYVARAGEPASTAAELRGRLREILPEHMVPAFFQFLPALPLTASGKVDRRALPAPEGRGSREEVYLAPRGPVEEALAKIWEEVLRRERVGAEDDFFALGGHSLLATQVISRLRRTLQVELPLKILFERPTIASLAAEIERARRGGEPVAVESRPVEWQMATVAAVPERLPLPTGADLPLSFAQERLWFIDQLEPGSAKYNIPSALQLDGPLRPAALAWALSQVERRHEALRTVFKARADRPVQVIGPAREPFPLPVVDLTGLRGLRREELAARLAGEEAGRPFDLGRGPLWRAALLRMAEERQLLLLTLHHIAADGWSMEVLVQEVAELYAAAVEGRPARLSELPIQYAKYALWQREWLRGEVLARQLAYWKRQLAGAPRALDLPTDRPRPAVQTFAGAILAFTLPADLERNLKALSGGVTLFMALLAAFQALLGRYSGQEDVVVGTPVAGRNHLVTEGLIGFFVNNLVIRTQLAGDPDFRGLLTRVQEGMLAALAHQDLPFERLVGELQLERCLSHAPLFQVVFVLQNIPFTPQVIPELRLTPLAVDNGTAKFDLTATLVPAGGGLTGTLEYNRDLFDRSTIGRLAGHFQALLAAAVAEPGRRVAELPLLAAAERHQLLAEWNDAIPAGSEPASVLHRRFAAQVARTPEALAVITEGEALSYAELATQAGRLARRLRRLGVGPEVVVGVCLERSLALVVAILGVLEAGGAYLPLDPTYPRERLDLLITDAAVPVIVTDETVASSLPNGRAVLVLLDRGGEDEGPVAPIVPVDPGVRPENLAYLIYTSGSTGRPRGVQVTHANVTRLLSSTAPWFRFGPCDVWTLFHSFAFDFSVWEIWGALAYGGTLVVVPYWVSR